MVVRIVDRSVYSFGNVRQDGISLSKLITSALTAVHVEKKNLFISVERWRSSSFWSLC